VVHCRNGVVYDLIMELCGTIGVGLCGTAGVGLYGTTGEGLRGTT